MTYWKPGLCAHVGRPHIRFWTSERSDDGQRIIYTKQLSRARTPELEALERERASILGVREVPPSRFTYRVVPERHTGKDWIVELPADLRGTHEVMYGREDEDRVDEPYSHFFRKEGKRWILASWTWWHTHECELFCVLTEPDCRYFISVTPWTEWQEGG